MNAPQPGRGAGNDRERHAAGDPGGKVPKRPVDTTSDGDARNDTGEDNQRRKGERPAQDYVRR